MSFQQYQIGSRIGQDLTVISAFETNDDRHPVYLAWDHRSWCPVVCKIFRNDAKAEQEYAILSRVAHPNIVRPLGTYRPAILLLEYLEGKTLQDYLADEPEGRLSVSDAVRTIFHIGAALERVHREGYVHLDLKPSNIMIVGGTPKLFDFGTARRIGGGRPPVVQGTDAYMAPEECSLGEVSPASDIFSLGVILFELVTGELPFAEGTDTLPYPQLSCEPACARAYGVAAPLWHLIKRCLARDPAQRPAMAELLPELHAFIEDGTPMLPEAVMACAESAQVLAA
ncbi:MAG: serine/threonine protein kinase [Alphaproteobacteria bacterium]|nr:serine/threonine protein kinase [Alphaproteobacteria bacterium]